MRSKAPEAKTPLNDSETFVVDRADLLDLLTAAVAAEDLISLKQRIRDFKIAVMALAEKPAAVLESGADGNTISMRRDVLVEDLDQIIEAQTIERARYYLRRFEKGISEIRTGKMNDINLHRWKEYDDIITDSLWLLPKRDTSGAHLAWYWGNFVPQIPHQLMLRYTKKGEWVLDPFLGSGTTLIECRRLGRNGLGIELSAEVADRAAELIERQPCKNETITKVMTGDARSVDLAAELAEYATNKVQLVIMHPPYHDIIRFTEDDRDLSNARTTDDFLEMFLAVLDKVDPLLERGRHLAIVIGDKYSGGEWVPLGFKCMNEVMQRGYLLKSIIVKNFDETRAKRDQKQLWRYRALAGGFYIFKHEYILLFKKR